jgi:hypothetical protein
MVGVFILILIVWGVISDHQDKMKVKVVQDVEEEFNLTERINEAKIILNKKNFYNDVSFTSTKNNYYEPDKTIGLCPKCGKGYLGIGKTFTGYDSEYHKYPTYEKYLRCNECGYRESYYNLKSRRTETKQGVSVQFKKDFEQAYSIL